MESRSLLTSVVDDTEPEDIIKTTDEGRHDPRLGKLGPSYTELQSMVQKAELSQARLDKQQGVLYFLAGFLLIAFITNVLLSCCSRTGALDTVAMTAAAGSGTAAGGETSNDLMRMNANK